MALKIVEKSTSTSTEPCTENEPEFSFDDFWKNYPRRVARKDAMKAWLKIDPKEHPHVMRGLMAARRCEQWTKDGGQFIPYPATWLNGERWYDEHDVEIEPTTPGGQVIDSRCSQFVNGERCSGRVVFWNRSGTKGTCRDCGPE